METYVLNGTSSSNSKKKLIVSILFLMVLAISIPVGVILVQNSQIFRSQASTNPVEFAGPNVTFENGIYYTSSIDDIKIQLYSPLKSPTEKTMPTPTPNPVTTPDPVPTPDLVPDPDLIPKPSAPFDPNVCWNNVIAKEKMTPYWPNGCKGSAILPDTICSLVVSELTLDEIDQYNAWKAAGSPITKSCQKNPPPVVEKPTIPKPDPTEPPPSPQTVILNWYPLNLYNNGGNAPGKLADGPVTQAGTMLYYRDQIEKKYGLVFKRHLAGPGGYATLRASGAIAPHGWPDITEYSFLGTPNQVSQLEEQANTEIANLAQQLTNQAVQGLARAQSYNYYTRAYKIANSQVGLDTAPEQPYNTEPVTIPFSFSANLSPGDPTNNFLIESGTSRTVFAQFIGQNGETQTSSATIIYRPTGPSNPISAPIIPTPNPVSAPIAPTGLINQSINNQADVNKDGVINTIDANIVRSNFGNRQGTGDVNQDGIVNALDYSIVVSSIR